MQRVSTAALCVALTAFISAVSLALIAAAWLMASHFLNGSIRSLLPKWLLMGLLIIGPGWATAQSGDTGAFAVVEERITQPNGQVTILYSIGTTFDTLPPPVRAEFCLQKRLLSTEPAWPDNDLPLAGWRVDFPATGSMMPAGVYTMANFPSSSAHKPGPWFWKRSQ